MFFDFARNCERAQASSLMQLKSVTQVLTLIVCLRVTVATLIASIFFLHNISTSLQIFIFFDMVSLPNLIRISFELFKRGVDPAELECIAWSESLLRFVPAMGCTLVAEPGKEGMP